VLSASLHASVPIRFRARGIADNSAVNHTGDTATMDSRSSDEIKTHVRSRRKAAAIGFVIGATGTFLLGVVLALTLRPQPGGGLGGALAGAYVVAGVFVAGVPLAGLIGGASGALLLRDRVSLRDALCIVAVTAILLPALVCVAVTYGGSEIEHRVNDWKDEHTLRLFVADYSPVPVTNVTLGVVGSGDSDPGAEFTSFEFNPGDCPNPVIYQCIPWRTGVRTPAWTSQLAVEVSWTRRCTETHFGTATAARRWTGLICMPQLAYPIIGVPETRRLRLSFCRRTGSALRLLTWYRFPAR
jgi:hypothetical protein